MAEFKFPTEIVELPSKGLVYPKENPLSSGQVEMKYMTAREEDILTNINYIQKGIVIEKLLKSLIISNINIDDLIIGDKNALLIAARILGYGSNYTFSFYETEHNIDLSILKPKKINESLFTSGKNEFSYTLPYTNTEVTFQLLTEKLEKKIDLELKGLAKINKDNIPEISTKMKHIILSVEGNYDRKTINEFVDNHLLARDAKALRDYIVEIQPDIDLSVEIEVDEENVTIELPISSNFFFPNK